jgi:hypothetical protein
VTIVAGVGLVCLHVVCTCPSSALSYSSDRYSHPQV